MRDRWIGMLLGVGAVAVTYGLTRLPHGWIYGAVLLGLVGWIGAGCVSRLRRLTEQDELTGLANRRAFERVLAREWARAQRYRRPLSILFIDLDDFGAVNKKYGHLTGDRALRWVCQLLSENIRETDLAVRWGGEEFVIVLFDADKDVAVDVIRRVRSELRERKVPPIEWPLTFSAGLAGGTAPRNLSELESWIDEADAAQRRAKSAGRDRYEVVA